MSEPYPPVNCPNLRKHILFRVKQAPGVDLKTIASEMSQIITDVNPYDFTLHVVVALRSDASPSQVEEAFNYLNIRAGSEAGLVLEPLEE